MRGGQLCSGRGRAAPLVGNGDDRALSSPGAAAITQTGVGAQCSWKDVGAKAAIYGPARL